MFYNKLAIRLAIRLAIKKARHCERSEAILFQRAHKGLKGLIYDQF